MKNNLPRPGKRALDARLVWLIDQNDALMRDECARLDRLDRAGRFPEHAAA
jgi:hypothetical protein